MNKKITSSALAALMIAGSTSFTAFAAINPGTAVIGDKAYDLNYLSTKATAEEQKEVLDAIVAGESIYVKDFAGNWVDNLSGETVEASVIPAVTYKDAEGNVTEHTAGDDAVVAEDLEIVDAEAAGVKKIEITFNKAVEDEAIVIKRGSITVRGNVAYNEDKTVATFTATSNLLAADYTVKVGELTEELTVKAEKIDSIELDSLEAVETSLGANTAKVGYKVYNQYGEDVTSKTIASNINWTCAPNATAADNNEGALTITAASGITWTPGKSTLILTGVDTSTGSVVNETVTVVSAAKLESLVLTGVENIGTADDQLINQGDTGSAYTWVVNYEAVDQYGNAIDAYDYLTNNVTLNVSGNGSAVAFAADPDDSTKAIIKVTPGAGSADETVVVTAVDTTSGANDSLTFKIEKDESVATFSMNLPSEIVVEGESIELPFEAYDQYGNEANTEAMLVDATPITFTTPSGDTMNFEVDPLTDKVSLVYTPSAAGTRIVYATLGTSVQQLTFNVEEAAVPTTIASISDDAILNLTEGATAELNNDSFVVKDQYDREMDLPTGYTIDVTRAANDTDVALTTGSTITLTGTATAGDTEFTAVLKNGTQNVAGSEIKFSAVTIDKEDISEYKVEELDKVFDVVTVAPVAPADYAEEVVVFGYLANGEKVALDWTTDIQAVNVVGKLSYNTTNHEISGAALADASKDETATILVGVNGAKGTVTLREDVTVTAKAPTAESIAVKGVSADLAANEAFDADNNVLAITKANVTAWNTEYIFRNTSNTRTDKVYFEVKDQYGVLSQLSPSFYYISEDSVTNAGTYSVSNTTGQIAVAGNTATAGDEFTITAVTDNGKSVSLKVIVK